MDYKAGFTFGECFDFVKGALDMDRAPVVLCNLEHIIVYMNPTAAERYKAQGGEKLVGKSLLMCHPPKAREIINKVLDWFRESTDHNMIYEFRNDEENKDVYMIALRREDGTLIGYYEKHEYRDREQGNLYDFGDKYRLNL